jgi:HAD superfamily hydrolase (TIGR01490 family)
MSVFDLDRTLISSNSSMHFCFHLVKRKLLVPTTLLHCALYHFQHVCMDLSLVKLHESVFGKFLKGYALDRLEAEVESFLENYLSEALYTPAVCKLRLAQHLGHYTVILSSSPQFLVKKIASNLGVHAVQATEYGVDKEGKLCHIASIMEGSEKAAWVLKMGEQLQIPPALITAYSDSIWDLPMLRAAGTAVAVRPDKKLRIHALRQKWDIL